MIEKMLAQYGDRPIRSSDLARESFGHDRIQDSSQRAVDEHAPESEQREDAPRTATRGGEAQSPPKLPSLKVELTSLAASSDADLLQC